MRESKTGEHRRQHRSIATPLLPLHPFLRRLHYRMLDAQRTAIEPTHLIGGSDVTTPHHHPVTASRPAPRAKTGLGGASPDSDRRLPAASCALACQMGWVPEPGCLLGVGPCWSRRTALVRRQQQQKARKGVAGCMGLQGTVVVGMGRRGCAVEGAVCTNRAVRLTLAVCMARPLMGVAGYTDPPRMATVG